MYLWQTFIPEGRRAGVNRRCDVVWIGFRVDYGRGDLGVLEEVMPDLLEGLRARPVRRR